MLRRTHHALGWVPIVPVDIVDDGEALASVSDCAVDFVVANHVIEHCADPIGTLENWLRVVRPGGIVYMAVPDKRRNRFDRKRALTSVGHVLSDYQIGPAAARRAYWAEEARRAGTRESDVEEFVRQRSDTGAHPHVWTDATFVQLLDACRELGLPFRVEVVQPVGMEFIVILRKNDAVRNLGPSPGVRASTADRAAP